MSKLSFLRYAVGANYGRFLDNLKKVSVREHRSLFGLILNFGYCFLRYGCGLSDYLSYEFWSKTGEQRREYVTIKDTDTFYSEVCPIQYKDFFSRKDQFLVNFAPYITRAFFVPQVDNLARMEEFLRDRDEVMVKPVDGLGGHGVHKQKTAEISDMAAFHRELVEGEAFLEELIVQHPEMAELCPSSVNTIRVMTVNAGGKAEILYAGLRVGAGADVDNFHAGGMGVHVNIETGRLEGSAINKSGERFEEHPITGVHFDKRQLPMWDEVRRICLEASAVNPNIHVVGWDVAITPQGPTFVEGNRRPGFDLPQMTSGRGRKDIMRRTYELLREAEEKRGSGHGI